MTYTQNFLPLRFERLCLVLFHYANLIGQTPNHAPLTPHHTQFALYVIIPSRISVTLQ